MARGTAVPVVVASASNLGGNALETTMSLSIAGGTLVVESTRPDPKGVGAPVTTTRSYKKG